MKNQPGTIKTMKNHEKTMKNYENQPGTIKTMKNHENHERPLKTMKNNKTSRKTNLEP